MDEEIKVGCARPVFNKKTEEVVVGENSIIEKKEEMKMIKVGKPAPLFEAQAYKGGKFTNVKLEDYKGKWVLLCFYPGDFTFVWATEIAAVAVKHQDLVDLGVEVLSVSVDSVFVHKMWNDHELSKMVDKLSI